MFGKKKRRKFREEPSKPWPVKQLHFTHQDKMIFDLDDWNYSIIDGRLVVEAKATETNSEVKRDRKEERD